MHNIFPAPLRQLGRTHVGVDGRKLVYFGGCDYFRLASHPRILRALSAGLASHGLNVAASRLTTGDHPLYHELEDELAKFFAVESAVLVPTGYVTNLVVAQALQGRFSHAFIDDQAHSSLSDAAQFLKCPVISFKHRDPKDLRRVLGEVGRPVPIVLSDGVFPHNGAIAPLKAYQATLPPNGMLLVDDAHGAGVHGNEGRGTIELEGINRRQVIQTITLSKAFGVYGGAVLGAGDLRERIVKHSALFAGCTPLPLPLACAAKEALHVLRTDASLRSRLGQNAAYVKERLRRAGLAVPDQPGPILALQPKGHSDSNDVQAKLLKVGIHPPFIRYRSGPRLGYFRFAISSEHSGEQLDNLLRVLTRCCSRLRPV
jgi:7-keto-8-aminopelargonate synthetase-like enzyme